MEKLGLNTQPQNIISNSLPWRVGLLRFARFLLVYSAALTFSLWVGYQVRFDFAVPDHQLEHFSEMLTWILPLQLLFLGIFRQFHSLPAYFGTRAMLQTLAAMSASGAIVCLVRLALRLGHHLPFGVILLDSLLGFAMLSLACFAWRLYRHDVLLRVFGLGVARKARNRRVAIIGAGHAGVALARELQLDRQSTLKPVAFFDDDMHKWRAQIMQIPVLGPPELLAQGAARSYQIDEAILSMPVASTTRIKAIVQLLNRAGIPYKTVPSLGEMAAGRYVTQLRSIQIEDLLGRDPVRLHTDEIRAMLEGKKVMITGAGGSIGSELCRQAAAFGASELLLVERCEGQLFVIEQELIRRGHGKALRPLAADILNRRGMRHIFDHYRPDMVFHAAAHKHVPMMETQPGEAVQNNTFGTALIARLCIEFGVDRFVLISTDKAINPTSVMGATKRLAEMVIQDLQARNHTSTRLTAVRFGNVLGSSGSVVPLFKEQIAAGGPVTVTHPLMKRYFMTIPEAVGLVLQSTVHANGGEVFVLDMGQPVKIVDLAKQMIQLCGFEPGRDIEIKFTGTRPGEKLFEELSYDAESVTRTAHHKVMLVRGEPPDSRTLESNLLDLMSAIQGLNLVEMKRQLAKAVPEYQFNEAGVRTSPPEARGSHGVPHKSELQPSLSSHNPLASAVPSGI